MVSDIDVIGVCYILYYVISEPEVSFLIGDTTGTDGTCVR